MYTLHNIETQVPKSTYVRGLDYYKNGKVRFLEAWKANHWTATVKGTDEQFAVELELDGSDITNWECDCPLGDRSEPCPHIVALALEIKATRKGGAAVVKATTSQERLKLAQQILAQHRSAREDAKPKPVQPLKPERLSTAQQIQAYEQLSRDEQLLIKIIALAWEGTSLSKCVDIYNEAGFKFGGNNLYTKDARGMLERLYLAGLLDLLPNNNYHCSEAFSHTLCEKIWKADADFPKIIPAVRKCMELSAYWHHGYDVMERTFREMRFARYTDNPDLFKKHFQAVASGKKYTPASLRQFWIPEPFDPSKLETLSPSICAFFFHERLSSMVVNLTAADAYYDYLVEHIAQTDAKYREELAQILAFLTFLRGNWPLLENIMPYCGPVGSGALTAMRHLVSGDTNAALEVYALTAKELRRSTRNPKAALTGIMGIFQLMAMFKANDAALYPKIEEQLAKCLKGYDYQRMVFGYFQGVLLFLQNNKQRAKTFLETDPPFEFDRFFWFLSQYWVDEKLIKPEKLENYQKKLEANGFVWMATEMLALLNVLKSGNVTALQSADDAIARLNIKPLTFLLPRIEEWENALNALLGLGGGPKSNAKENDARLIWLVDFERRSVQPKEQVFGKNGWSAGRNVAYQRLLRNEVASMTDHDRRVARHIGGWGNYYHIDEEKALRDLVGHPLLFLMKSPEVAVQFLEEKPVLIAKEVESGFELKFSHNISDENLQIVKESPTRYKLLNITAEHIRIARAFNGKSLVVPERGSERLQKVLTNLSGLVTVQSAFDTEDTTLPIVSPDSRTCVHLLPVGDGFHVEFLAKPFSTTAPYFKPGQGEASVIALVDGQRIRTTRDLKAEKKNAQQVREQVEILREKRPQHDTWELEDSETCLELLLQLNPLVANQSIILEWPKGEKFRIASIAGLDQFKARISAQNNWFEVSGELRVDEHKVLTMQELLALSQQSKSQFIELSPGKFLALTQEFRRRLQEINGLLSLQKNGSLQLHPLAAPALQPFTDALKHVEVDKKYKENLKRFKKAFSTRYDLPKKFQAELRPYQQEGYEWLCRCAEGGVGACLADDMGLGKTVQALAMLTQRANLGPALVVAPASVCRNWMAETAKFAPTLRALLFGDGDRAALVENADKNDIVVVTYDLMAREADIFTAKKFATVILDEAQAIKNRATRRSETAMQLQGDFRMIMTGTPLENHLGELWNLFQFCNPGLLGTLDSFNERFAIPIERFQDESRRDQLRRLVQPFMLRRRKAEVLKDLPEKTEITLTVELSAEERAFYEALRRQALMAIQSDDSQAGERHLKILAEIMRLRRAACHPALVDKNAGILESSKLRLFGDVVEELLENGHKALVFSQFVSHLEILENYLKRKKILYQYLDGQTPLPTRQKRIEAFQSGEGDLFLISLKAGGVGLNLTAADYVIHMDPWWNPAVEDQATDRAHRIGQEKPVTVYRLVAEDTIEEKIIKLHEQKRDLADSLLSGADMSAKLSADELLRLIAEN